MTDINRRSVAKGIAWSVPAVAAATAAPAFAASSPTPDPTVPSEPTPVTNRYEFEDFAPEPYPGQTESRARVSKPGQGDYMPNASAQGGVNSIGNAGGLAVVSFELPADFTSATLTFGYLPYQAVTADYWVNGTKYTTATTLEADTAGNGSANMFPAELVINSSDLVVGTNTVKVGNPVGTSFGYADYLDVTYTPEG